MRLQLRRSRFLLLAALGLGAVASGARAADQVTVRGAYYREPSTRVIQPVVDIQKDLPHGLDVDAHYLVDAITSASAAAGTTVDQIFTEIRNEVGLAVGKNWDRARATLGYRYSAESDYWSHGFGGSLSGRFWGDTATLTLSGGISLDTMSARGRTPKCAHAPSTDCSLDSYFGGLAYTQVLSPVAVAQVDGEVAYLDGFQGNLYRTVPNLGYETPPDRRLRNALAGRIAYYFPSSSTGLQLHYRFYWDLFPGAPLTPADPWGIRAHTIEARLYQKLSRSLEVRLTYRQHLQNHADFWCSANASSACYQIVTEMAGVTTTVASPYYSNDPKLAAIHTEYPEVKLLWEAERWRAVPFFRWFSTATFEISYGYYMQNDSFGNAHVLQAGATMPY